MSPGVEYLLRRLAELEAGMAAAADIIANQAATIADLERSRRQVRTAKAPPPADAG